MPWETKLNALPKQRGTDARIHAAVLWCVTGLLGALCAGALVIGAVALRNQAKIEQSQHDVCLSRHSATIIANKRVVLVNLLIESVIASTRKGERELANYKVPHQIVQLEHLQKAKPTPVPEC